MSQNPVKQLKNGQQDSVEQIVDAHYDAIYRYCYFHVQQKNEAEDLTQDVFMHFIRHIDSYDNQGTPRAYLMKIAKNICINWAKKKKPDLIEAVEDYSVTATEIVSVEDYLVLKSIIEQLPDEERDAIVLRYVHDLPINEVATIIECSRFSVRYRIKKGLATLKKLLKERM